MTGFNAALIPNETGIRSDKCHKIAREIFANVFLNHFSQETILNCEYKHLNQAKNQGLSALFQKTQLLCRWHLDDWVCALQKLAHWPVTLEEANVALRPFVIARQYGQHPNDITSFFWLSFFVIGLGC